MAVADHNSFCLDPMRRDASLDRPCSYCKVLQLDDAEHGGSIQFTKDRKRHVSFGTLPGSWLNDIGLKPESRLELKLGYKRDDTFPDLPELAVTASRGCEMCSLLRNDILSVWEQEEPVERNWFMSIDTDQCLELPEDFDEGSQNELDRVIEEANSRGATGHAKLRITEITYLYRDPDNFGNKDPGTASDERPWLDALVVDFNVIWEHAKRVYVLHYNFHADPSDPCASWLNIGRQTVASGSLSGSRLERLKDLISKSLERIPVPKTNQYLPTRLIDVSPSDSKNPRLVISDELSPAKDSDGRSVRQYVALSYCWGPKADAEKQLKTTRETLNDHLKCIELEKMPKTIADAVKVCRLLKIRYIWIDALCIVQDDREDWSMEAFEMANVYANSLLTFCILRGNSCLTGFLHPRDVQPTLNLNFHSTLDPSVQGKLRLRMLNPVKKNYKRALFGRGVRSEVDDPAGDDIKDASWSTRAWILQEARLSPRKILFGDRMFHMSCNDLNESEDGTVFTGHSWGEVESMSGIHGAMSHWYNLVTTYKTKTLSYVQDRLPAISALARLLSNQHPEEKYLAGLWESNLCKGLIWNACSPAQHAGYLEALSSPYIAPSWSWACHPYGLCWLGGVGVLQFNPEFEVRGHCLSTDKANPYGCVYGGYLTLHAKAIPLPRSHDGRPNVHSRPPNEGNSVMGVDFPLFLRSEDYEYIAHLQLDWNDLCSLKEETYPDGPIERLWMVLISNSELHPWDMDNRPDLTDPEILVGLLLLPTDNDHAFIKVGLWYSENRGLGGRKFWNDVQSRDVKLV